MASFCRYCHTAMTKVEVEEGVCYGCGRVTERTPWAAMAKFAPIFEKEIAADKCKYCQEWEKTGRSCTLGSHGECDCPLCTGLCECPFANEYDEKEETDG